METNQETIHKKKYKFTKENASFYGSKKKRMTYKKRLSCILNPMKSGRFAQSKEILEKIQPTFEEKLAGITKEDNIKLIKKLAKEKGVDKTIEFLDNHEKKLNEVSRKIQLIERLFIKSIGKSDINNLTPKECEKLANLLKKLLYYEQQQLDRNLEFGKIKFSLGQPDTIINQSVNVDIENQLGIALQKYEQIMNKWQQKQGK